MIVSHKHGLPLGDRWKQPNGRREDPTLTLKRRPLGQTQILKDDNEAEEDDVKEEDFTDVEFPNGSLLLPKKTPFTASTLISPPTNLPFAPFLGTRNSTSAFLRSAMSPIPRPLCVPTPSLPPTEMAPEPEVSFSGASTRDWTEEAVTREATTDRTLDGSGNDGPSSPQSPRQKADSGEE